MVSLLLVDCIIWYGLITLHKKDKASGPYPENPQFDSDLDKLWNAAWKPCPAKSCEVSKEEDKIEDLMLKEEFEDWLRREANRDLELEDYLWREGIINPEEAVWVEGVPLEPGNKKDYQTFLEIKNQAYLKDMFNEKNMSEGGQEDLYIAWFMLKGCSKYGAEQLLDMNVNPWDVSFDI